MAEETLPAVLEPDLLQSLSEEQATALNGLMGQLGKSGAASGPMGLEVPEDSGNPITLPTLKIRQRMTTDTGCPEEAKDGDLYITTGDIVSNPIKVIPIALWKEHVKWEPGGAKTIECRSPNGVTGNVYGTCNDCPDKPWRDGKQQACNENLNAVFLTEDMKLLRTRFSGTSYTAGRDLKRFCMAMPTMWAKYFSLTTDKRKNMKGEFHVFVVKATTEVPPEALQKVSEHFCRALVESRAEFIKEFYARLEATSTSADASGDATITTVDLSDSEDPSYDAEL